MSDVAARAGVSHQTVSRVLNHPDLVHPETQERVRAAIAELGYRRNMSARALATSRTRMIGVVTPATRSFGPTYTTVAIQDAARAAGYAILTAGTVDAAASPHDVLEFFLDHGVEGVVVVAPTTEFADAARGLAGSLPIIVIATGLTTPAPLHVVAIDHEQGARDATRHLIDLGHRHIAHVAGPFNWFDARARLAGWRAELEAAGLDVPEPIEGGWDSAQGYAAAQRMLSGRVLPTAVFTANDLLALGMMRAFHEAGVRMPDDVAVVGYDDISGSDFYEPPLTTVRQPFQEVGHQVMEALLTALDGGSPAPLLSRPELIVRASSGAHTQG
ncbi:LacI family DNA-binding transcriptional regulator [Georgenia wangjunii]|uniref:LacI family DNA-binding transcriptional regulator n=1 Tax=Georgenia wangjunii TaxID=3117730 RepID=UPI002F269B37